MTVWRRSSVRDTKAGDQAHSGARPSTLAPAIALVFALALVLAAPAGAKLVRLGGRTLSYLPAPDARSSHTAAVRRAAMPAVGGAEGGGATKPSSSSLLVYHQPGPVMPSNTNYTIFWAPGGAASYPTGYQSGIDRFFEDLAHDSGGVFNSDSVLAQYGDSQGHFAAYSSHFGGTILDTDPYPANGCGQAPVCLTDAQFKAEIRAVVEARKLPMDLEHEYFVLTPEGVESCMEAEGKVCSDGTAPAVRAYCAYHRFVEVGGSSVIVYANDPYVAGLSCDPGQHPNGNASDATIAGGLAHEHSESVTDPLLNAWYDSKGDEVADKCRSNSPKAEFGEYLGQTAEGVNYNQIIDGHDYLYQQMWSNQAAACLQRTGEYPAITKMKPKSGSPAGGTTVTITGHGFTSPATVHFGEATATGVKVESPTSIVAVSPAGAPSTKVPVTVTTAAGTSAPTKKAQFKYKSH